MLPGRRGRWTAAPWPSASGTQLCGLAERPAGTKSKWSILGRGGCRLRMRLVHSRDSRSQVALDRPPLTMSWMLRKAMGRLSCLLRICSWHTAVGTVHLCVFLFLPYDPIHNGCEGIQGVKTTSSACHGSSPPGFCSSQLCHESFCPPVSLLFSHLEPCGTFQVSVLFDKDPKPLLLALPEDSPTSLGRAGNAVS